MRRSTRSLPATARSHRFEIFLAAVGLCAWSVALGALFAGRGLAGLTRVSLYPLYLAAAASGWGLGNIWVARTRRLEKAVKRLLLPVYLLTAPGLLFVLWATASLVLQTLIPMAPVYASAIATLFFLVPLSFDRSRVRKGWVDREAGDRESDDR